MSNDAKVILTAEDRTAQAFRAVRANMQGLESAASRASRALGAIGVGVSMAGIVTGLTRAAFAAIEFGDEVQKAAARTGMGAAAFAELASAAKLADVDMATLSKGLRTMQVNISQAATGAKAPIEAFRALGLEVKQLEGLQADKQMELIFEQISRLESPLDRARAGTELFGRAWESFAPLAAEGASGLRAAREEIEKLGGSLTDEQIQQLADADTAIKQLDASWDAFARTLTAKASPALAGFFNELRRGLGGSTRIEELQDQIDLLKQFEGRGAFLSGAMRGPDIGTGFFSAQEIAAKRRQLENQLAVLRGGSNFSESDILRQEQAAMRAAGGIRPPGYQAPATSPKAAGSTAAKEVQTFAQQVDQALREIDIDVTNDVVRGMNDIANETRVMSTVIEEAREPLKGLSVFAEQAARNMQDAFAQFFYDFDGGLEGMLASFADTLRQMVAQMAASKIFDWLGTALGGSGNAFIAGIGNFLSGARASGGPVSAGGTYLVGERGPELFVPGSNGQILPNGYGVTMNQSIQIDARGGDAAQIMAMLPAWGEQIKRQTVAEVINLQRRGRLA